MDGERLLQLMMKHPPAAQQQLLRVVMMRDYPAPTCAACGVKFIRRKARTTNEF